MRRIGLGGRTADCSRLDRKTAALALADLVDLRAVLTRLSATSFHIRPELIDRLLAEYAKRES